MQNLNHFYAIPARPEGPVNPAEEPVAALVLEAACYDLLPEERRPALYRRLSDRFKHLSEELWAQLFGGSDAPAAEECRVIQMQQQA